MNWLTAAQAVAYGVMINAPSLAMTKAVILLPRPRGLSGQQLVLWYVVCKSHSMNPSLPPNTHRSLCAYLHCLHFGYKCLAELTDGAAAKYWINYKSQN